MFAIYAIQTSRHGTPCEEARLEALAVLQKEQGCCVVRL